MNRRLELVKSDPKVKVVAELEDRVLLEICPTDVEIVEPFKSGRSGALDNALLAKSMKEGVLYAPLLYVAVIDDKPHYQVADGLQRLLSALDNGTLSMVFQWITAWETPMQAFEKATSANSFRHEIKPVDILTVFRAGGFSVVRMLEITSESETQLRRLERISRHKELDETVKEGWISVGQLNACLEKCQGHVARERRFVDYVVKEVEKAKAKAKKAQDYIDRKDGQHIDAAQRKKAEVTTHLKSIRWDAIKTELAKVNQTGPLVISKKTRAETVALRVGDSEEWKERLALFGPFGQSLSKVTVEDLEMFVGQLPLVKKKLKGIIERKKREMQSSLPTDNPSAPEEVEEELDDQDDDFDVGDDTDDDDVD